MRQHSGTRVVLLAALALIALPAVAEAKVKFVTVKNNAFTAELPEGWKQITRRKYGLRQDIARYAFASENRNQILRINVQKMVAGDFKKLAEADYQRMRARVSDPKIHKVEITNEDGKDVAFHIFEGLMLRKDFMRPYLLGRVFVRDTKRQKHISVTLAMSNEKLDADRFSAILEKILHGLVIHDPAPEHVSSPAPAKAGK